MLLKKLYLTGLVILTMIISTSYGDDAITFSGLWKGNTANNRHYVIFFSKHGYLCGEYGYFSEQERSCVITVSDMGSYSSSNTIKLNAELYEKDFQNGFSDLNGTKLQTITDNEMIFNQNATASFRLVKIPSFTEWTNSCEKYHIGWKNTNSDLVGMDDTNFEKFKTLVKKYNLFEANEIAKMTNQI